MGAAALRFAPVALESRWPLATRDTRPAGTVEHVAHLLDTPRSAVRPSDGLELVWMHRGSGKGVKGAQRGAQRPIRAFLALTVAYQ